MLNRIPHWFCLFCNKFFYLSGSSSVHFFLARPFVLPFVMSLFAKKMLCRLSLRNNFSFMGQNGSNAWLRSIGQACAAGKPARVKEKFLRNRHQSYTSKMQNWIILRTKNVIWPLVKDAGCLCGLSERKIQSRRLQRHGRKARQEKSLFFAFMPSG